jgi:hypothetical protein
MELGVYPYQMCWHALHTIHSAPSLLMNIGRGNVKQDLYRDIAPHNVDR